MSSMSSSWDTRVNTHTNYTPERSATHTTCEFIWLYLNVINEETSIISIDFYTSLFYLRLMIMVNLIPADTHQIFNHFTTLWMRFGFRFSLCKWNKFHIHLYDTHISQRESEYGKRNKNRNPKTKCLCVCA